MKTLSSSEAQNLIEKLLEETGNNNQPVRIEGEKYNGVLISEAMWDSIVETQELSKDPELKASIRSGMNTSLDQCDNELDW